VDDVKRKIRISVWRKLEEYEIAIFPRPCYGKIPNFIGSLAAANKVLHTLAFKKAKIVFSNTDLPQKPIREAALQKGKILIMSTPELRRGFVIIDPSKISRRSIPIAATLKGALIYGKKVDVLEDLKIDMYVIGSVAASPNGARLGKGNGFYDLEYAVLRELKVIDEKTPVFTTIHDVQLVDGIPMEKHDVPVDYIATPSRLIATNTEYEKPRGIFWEELTIDQINRISVLKRLAGF